MKNAHPISPCAKSLHGGQLIVHDPQNTFHFSTTIEHREALRTYLEAAFADPNDPYQAFCNQYIGVAGHGPERWPRSLSRFSLCFDLIDRFLPEGGSWVDVGSMGFETMAMRRRRPDLRSRQFGLLGCIVLEDERGMHYAAQLTPGCVFVEKCDVERGRLPIEDAAVDVLSAFEVVEHFKFSPQNFAMEANRVLKPGGVMLITTPNAHSADALSRLVHNRHPAECDLYHRDAERGRVHPAEYARQQIWQLATAYGFECVSLVSFDGAPYSPQLERFVRALWDLRQGEGLALPPDYGEKWLLIARKVNDFTGGGFPRALYEGA